MKKFSEYLRAQAEEHKRIEEQYAHVVPCQSITENGVIGDIDEFYTDDITSEFIDMFMLKSCIKSYFTDSPSKYWTDIYETLIVSHDYTKLIEKLKQFFGDNYVDHRVFSDPTASKALSFTFAIDEHTKHAKDIEQYALTKNFKHADCSSNIEELIKILDFFNYYISTVTRGTDKTYLLLCEPKYSEKCNDLVYKKYNGVLYHITPNKNVNKILKRGLQLKGDKATYRYIEPRINFFLANENEVISRAKYIAQQRLFDEGSYTILKIDLNYGEPNKYSNTSYNVDFYHDTLYNEDWSVYTYGLIHPRFITVVDTTNIVESRGDAIDDAWIDNNKPVQTIDGRQAIVTNVDMSNVPNIIKGQVKIGSHLFDYEWEDDGTCIKATDRYGNPKKPEENDNLVKA